MADVAPSPNTAPVRLSVIWMIVGLIGLGALSCRPGSTPPAPDMAAGVYVAAGYEYFHWKEGLAVLIWHDAIHSSSCDSRGSSGESAHVVNCQALSEAGHGFEWQIETVDGVAGHLTIDDKPYNISGGNVFIVHTTDGIAEVLQRQRDLSHLEPDHEVIVEFSLADANISRFIEDQISD